MQSRDGGTKQSYTGLVNPTCVISKGLEILAGAGKAATSASQVVCVRPWNSVGTSYQFSDPIKRSTVCLSISANELGENWFFYCPYWQIGYEIYLTKMQTSLHGSWSALAVQCVKICSNNTITPIIDNVWCAHAGMTCAIVTFRFNKYNIN